VSFCERVETSRIDFVNSALPPPKPVYRIQTSFKNVFVSIEKAL